MPHQQHGEADRVQKSETLLASHSLRPGRKAQFGKSGLEPAAIDHAVISGIDDMTILLR